MLNIKNLHVAVDGKPILKGINLQVRTGEVIALMGPNGSGKTTLAHALLGDPRYVITKGSILVDNTDVTSLPVEHRARAGLFLSFQHPAEISGVPLHQFLRLSYNQLRSDTKSVHEFVSLVKEALVAIGLSPTFAERSVNEGFSGGEKKKSEMLQLVLLHPKYAVLDETDSGLDVDALKTIAKGIKQLTSTGFLLITHNPKFFEYLAPDKVVVMKEGRIVHEGGQELVKKLEAHGFSGLVDTGLPVNH